MEGRRDWARWRRVSFSRKAGRRSSRWRVAPSIFPLSINAFPTLKPSSLPLSLIFRLLHLPPHLLINS